MKTRILYIFVIWAIVTFTVHAETETEVDHKEDKVDVSEDDISPLQDQDYTEKDYSKRTLFNPGSYDNYGLAKHVKLRNGQKLVIGYSPVDLKYVPVIKHLRNGWRFKPKQVNRPRPMWQLPIRPKPDNQGWKPMVPAHVPPPQAWQNQGWSKPAVTVLKPIRPSAPDHHHHEDQHIHQDHHNHHADVHHDIVHDHHHVHQDPVLHVPSVPQVLEVPHVHLPEDHFHRDIYGHYDLNHVHFHPQQQFVYYTHPLVQVTKPDLGVLPLGASFPVPVASAVPTAAHHYHAPTTAPFQPHYHLVPQTHYHSAPEAVHEIPAPHFHPTQIVSQVVPQVIPQISHFHPTPTVAVPHYDYHHDHQHFYPDYHFPQVHETPVEPPQVSPTATPQVVLPLSHGPHGHSIEYHGHLAHLIQQQSHNAHQYVPENYNPNILPGSTGTLSPGFLNPGITDLQIPEHLPEHPNYSVTQATEATYYHQGQGNYLPEGIYQPAHELEPPINK